MPYQFPAIKIKQSALFLFHEKEGRCVRQWLQGEKMTGQKPISKFKAGMVSAAIWENQIEVKGKTVTMLKATVQRRYKDKDGDWKSSQSFSRNEIPLAIYCLQQAFETMIGEGNSDANGESVEEETVM